MCVQLIKIIKNFNMNNLLASANIMFALHSKVIQKPNSMVGNYSLIKQSFCAFSTVKNIIFQANYTNLPIFPGKKFLQRKLTKKYFLLGKGPKIKNLESMVFDHTPPTPLPQP